MPTPYPTPYEIFPQLPGLPVTDLNRFSSRRVFSSIEEGAQVRRAVVICDKPAIVIAATSYMLMSPDTDGYLLLCDADRLDGRGYAARYAVGFTGSALSFVAGTFSPPAQGWFFEKGIVAIAGSTLFGGTLAASAGKNGFHLTLEYLA